MGAAKDIPVGYRYGRWTVLGPFTRLPTGAALFPCRCDCGTEQLVKFRGEFMGKSCGCLQRDTAARLGTTHGASGTRLYRIYMGLFERCYRETATEYLRYGGRGITVSEAWSTFEAFRDWAESHGYDKSLSLDRVDNDGNYSPDNCRWATNKEQLRNTSRNRMLTVWGETKCLAEWAEDPRCVISAAGLRSRLRYDWSPEDALVVLKGSRPYGRMTNGSYRRPDTVNRTKKYRATL